MADGIIFGSPIYFGDITGMLRCLMERLLFQYLVYDANYSSLAPKKMPTAFIYTMNVTEDMMRQLDYPQHFSRLESFVGNIFTPPEILYAYNTYQFPDYSKYKSDCFSEKDKAQHREKFFPVDCRNAYELGQKLAKNTPSF